MAPCKDLKGQTFPSLCGITVYHFSKYHGLFVEEVIYVCTVVASNSKLKAKRKLIAALISACPVNFYSFLS